MLKYAGWRLLQAVPVVIAMSFVVFIVTNLLPGDAAFTVAGQQASAAQIAEVREQLGLNENIFVRFFDWVSNLLRGDLGVSLATGEAVTSMLARTIPVTVELTILAILVGLVIGIPAGVLTAVKRNTWLDNWVSALALFGISMPWFWLGLLLIFAFSLGLGWFPASGFVGFFANPGKNLLYMALPAFTVGIGLSALVLRQTRAALMNVMEEDYVRTAISKGLTPRRVVLRHGLRNALIPVTTVVGLQVGSLLGGSVITETIFTLPGLGRMLVDGIFARDYPVIQGALMLIVLFVLLVNLITDMLYSALDPKVAV